MSHKSYRTGKFHCLVNCRSQQEQNFRKAVSDCVAELHYLIIRNRIKHYFSKLSSLNEAESWYSSYLCWCSESQVVVAGVCWCWLGPGNQGLVSRAQSPAPAAAQCSVWCGLSAAAGQIISSEIARYNQHQVWVLIMSSADWSSITAAMSQVWSLVQIIPDVIIILVHIKHQLSQLLPGSNHWPPRHALHQVN